MRRAFFVLVIATVVGIRGAGSGQASRALLLDPDDPAWTQEAPTVSTVIFETSKGRIVFEMRREWAPHGVDRFYNLVRHGFYDGARFFRVRPATWIQFGIPGDPKIAQRWRTRTIPDDPLREPNVRGTIAYAFKDPNGRSTQAFINLRDNRATHDKEFVPFGRIVEGMDVADSLYDGYGEGPGGIRGGKQDPVFEGGNVYLSRVYPRLDYIARALLRASRYGEAGSRRAGGLRNRSRLAIVRSTGHGHD